jgi:hypothetical protein
MFFLLTGQGMDRGIAGKQLLPSLKTPAPQFS